MEKTMWQVILSVFTAILTIVMKLIGKNKTAEEILPDPSDTEKAQQKARDQADEKYGKETS